jgi:UDP-N-acetylmuramate--alanine ligase
MVICFGIGATSLYGTVTSIYDDGMKVFCSGIGGIGLSAYASHMRALGHEVCGTDKSESDIVASLRSQGIDVTTKQDGSAVKKGIDLFVYSEAVPPESPERVKALELNIRQISYFAALGELTAGKDLICICGTHGKSSTTSMAAKVFIDAGLDPNVVVGTKTADLGGTNCGFECTDKPSR